MAAMGKMMADHKAQKLKARREVKDKEKFFQHPL
jgi:hypothetical protein